MRKWLAKRNLKTLVVMVFVALGVTAAFIYFNDVSQSLPWKALTAVAAILFSFLFLFVSKVTLQKTNFAKNKASDFLVCMTFSFIVVIYFVASHLIGSNDPLLLLPLSGLLLYWMYIEGNFINTQPNDSEHVKLRVESLKSYLYQRTDFRLVLVFVLSVLLLPFIKGILPIPPTFGALYYVSLTVYAVIFSVVTAFGILGLGQGEANSPNAVLKRPLLGLAHMCVAFFLVCLVGTVLGVDVDTSLFATGTTLGKAFSWETLGVGVIRILLIESIFISFPFTLMYLYAILRTFLLGSTGSTGRT